MAVKFFQHFIDYVEAVNRLNRMMDFDFIKVSMWFENCQKFYNLQEAIDRHKIDKLDKLDIIFVPERIAC